IRLAKPLAAATTAPFCMPVGWSKTGWKLTRTFARRSTIWKSNCSVELPRPAHAACFQQNDPHPDPLPSDGRGNSQTRHPQLPQRLDSPTDGGRFSLSHPMGEGRGEGDCAPKSEVVFARALTPFFIFRSPVGAPARKLPQCQSLKFR